MREFNYRAFISYSWADASWGKWLQGRLETYRTPAALVGKEGAYGPVRARLHPIFRDREDQSAGASISASLVKGLDESEFLIVICSPNSAKSQWCEQEIAWFKTHRNPDKILALIVDGEPGDAEQNCFPKSLTHRVNDDLTVTDDLVDAPLAADARITGDGKRKALLKIVSAMLGVELDELVSRDERRRTIRTRIVVGSSLALVLMMSGLTVTAIQARNEAEFQRNEADGLVEFMLTDLRDRLEPVGRLDALDVVGGRALDYYAKQRLASLDADALGRRARALLLVGEISNMRGNSEEALQAFRQAAATTGEQLARDPDNEQRIFDHAQSVFWVGAIAYGRADNDAAEEQFREYKRLADRLVALNHDKPEWRMESSYEETNLGVMFDKQQRYEEAERAFAEAVEQIEAVAKSEEWSADRQIELGLMVNWEGTSAANLGKSARAMELHDREIAIYEEILRRDPANTMAKYRLGVAWNYKMRPLIESEDINGAVGAGLRALKLIGELRRIEPDNTEWHWSQTATLFSVVEYYAYAGRFAEARKLLEAADRGAAELAQTDETNTEWTQGFVARSMRASILVPMLEKDWNSAARATNLALARIADLTDPSTASNVAAVYRLAGDTREQMGRKKEAQDLWAKGYRVITARKGSEAERYVLLKRTGRQDESRALAAELDRRGYRHPAYLAER